MRNGEAYLVAPDKYAKHLQTDDGKKLVSFPFVQHEQLFERLWKQSTCVNHKAVNQENLERKNRDITGIGASACAFHGCIVPHSVVDFQKGERYALIFYLTLR